MTKPAPSKLQVKRTNFSQKSFLLPIFFSFNLLTIFIFITLIGISGCGGGGGGDSSISGNISSSLEQKWSFTTGNSIHSSPAIDEDGIVYIGSDDGYLYALDPNGDLKWKFPAGGIVLSSPAIGEDGTIYIGSVDKSIYAVTGQGALRWSYPTEGSVLSAPALDSDGTIYAGSNDGHLYALSNNGALKWSSDELEGWVSSPAIGIDGTVYVGAGDVDLQDASNCAGKIYALDSQDGKIKWDKDIAVISRPAIGSDGTVYIGSTNGYVYALDSEDGRIKWSYATKGPVLSSPKVITNGKDLIIVGSDDQNLYAFESTGALSWKSELANKIRSSAQTGPDNTIYIGCHDGCLHAVMAQDGTKLGEFKTSKPITSIPAVDNQGVVYFGSQNSKVYAIKNKDANALRLSF